MKTFNIRLSLFLAAAFVFMGTSSAGAQCDLATLGTSATVQDALDCLQDQTDQVSDQAKVSAADVNNRTAEAIAVEDKAAAEVHPAIVKATNATTPPDAFAGRIHASYQDFFNLLSFGINKIEESEDGQALTVRFNPLRKGRNLLGLTLTAARPQLSEDVTQSLEGIAEDQRSDVTEKLDGSLTETDDLTWALSYSLQSRDCALGRGQTFCWGRSDKIYKRVLANFLIAADTLATESSTLDAKKQEVTMEITRLAFSTVPAGSVAGLPDIKLSDLPSDTRTKVLEQLGEFASLNAEITENSTKRIQRSGLGSLFTLVDNQPQLSVTGSYHDLGRFGGQDETSINIELAMGLMNLNRLFSDASGRVDTALTTLEGFADKGVPTDKLVFSASYKRRSRFSLTDLGIGDLGAGFTPIKVPRSSELKVHLQWGRPFKADLKSLTREADASEKPDPLKARWDLTVDGVRNTKDGIRTENRWVASYTLTFPVRDQMTFPITINWANEPEFLGMPRRQLSAHFGISYRLPWEPEPE